MTEAEEPQTSEEKDPLFTDALAATEETQTAEETQSEEQTEAEERVEKPAVAAPAVPSADSGVAKALSDLAAAIKPQMTPEQQEAQLEKIAEANGMTVQALKFMGGQMQNVALQAQLPMAKKLGKREAQDALGEFSEDLIAKVEEEMGKLNAVAQANPEAWKEMAYLVMGKNMKSLKPKARQQQQTEDTGEDTPAPAARRVVTAGSGGLSSARRGAAAPGKGPAKQYSEFEQHLIDRQFGGKAEEYEKYKGSKQSTVIEKFEAGAGAGAADKELARLTAENT